MITALIVTGILSLLLGGAFYWLNLNSPVQTCIPAVLLPFGLLSLVSALGGLLL